MTGEMRPKITSFALYIAVNETGRRSWGWTKGAVLSGTALSRLFYLRERFCGRLALDLTPRESLINL
jgi:hypothetical protein